jgi:glycosyltransferase involved in cell wall biosynthesis
MNIIECHFEFGGFDDHLVKGGISVYLWNLCRRFRAAGHTVTAVTAAHGLLGRLRERHDLVPLEWTADLEIPVRLDPEVWRGHPAEVRIPVSAAAHRLRIDGIDIVVLSGGPLDDHTEAFYPPYELKGRDLSFLKPLVFQVVAARYLQDTAAPGTVVHLHEPYYHYLVPAAVRDRGLVTVSTVQSNMPVNKKVYGPEVRTLLAYLGVDASPADGLADPPLDAPLHRAMRAYLPRTLLYNDYPDRPGHDYVSILGLVARAAHAVDFLSPGQLEHVVSQGGTPFEQLFAHLAVRRELHDRLDRLVVGGCAIGAEWLASTRDPDRRARTLERLGLDPSLPAVYHNARYAPQHKGQQEMFRALLRLLDEGERCNVLLHCLSPTPLDDPELAELVRRHPALVHLETGALPESELVDWATASDLCLFPSKFEMDTFLMAMGEAMACGAVPVATAQRGMRHFGHAFDLDDPGATGLALPRSFRVDDPILTDAIHDGLARMLAVVREEPERMAELRARAVAVARRFTWDRTANRFLETFAACSSGAPPAALSRAPAEPPPAPAGRVQAHREGDATLVRWDGAAVRVEAVVPEATIALAATPDGSFAGRIPRADLPHLALLITLPDGRMVWDEAVVGA